MSILSILIAICVVGIVLWLINGFLPMDGKIKTVLNAVVMVVLIVWLLKVFGVWHYLSQIHV